MVNETCNNARDVNVKHVAMHVMRKWSFTSIAETNNFIKKETLAQAFSCEFCEISKNNFSYALPSVAASDKCLLSTLYS